MFKGLKGKTNQLEGVKIDLGEDERRVINWGD